MISLAEFDVKLKKDTVLKVPYINSVLGKETLEEFHRRIAHVGFFQKMQIFMNLIGNLPVVNGLNERRKGL